MVAATDQEPLQPAVVQKKKPGRDPTKMMLSKLQIFSELQLLISSPFAVILPLVGFIGQCILVRYRDNYQICLVEQYEGIDLINQSEDKLMIYLRVLIAFTFLFSFSYFFCIQPINRTIMAINTVVMEVIIIGSVVAAIVSFSFVGVSKCSYTSFGKMVNALAAVIISSAFITNVLKIYTFLIFTASGSLPGIFNCLF